MGKIIFIVAFAVLLTANAAGNIPTRDNLLSPVRTVTTSGGAVITVDETPATFKVRIPPASVFVPAETAETPAGVEKPAEGTAGEEAPAETEPDIAGARLFPSYVEAAKAVSGVPLVSVDICGRRYEQFGYGALAAVEVKLEDGFGVLEAGKQRFLVDLLARLKTIYDGTSGDAQTYARYTMVFVVVAIMLGRGEDTLPPEVVVPAEIVEKAKEEKKTYLERNPHIFYASAPYAWREDLGRIMARDRWLSQPLEPGDRDYNSLEKSMLLTEAINSDPSLLDRHRFIWDVYGALVGAGYSFTVPEMSEIMAGDSYADIMADPDKRFLEVKRDAIALVVPFRLLPEARSLEFFLIDKLVAKRKQISYGTFENLVRAVRATEVKLEPGDDSSWRALEAYAVDAIIRPDGSPEVAKITPAEAYRNRLLSRLLFAVEQEPSGAGMLTEGGAGAAGLGPAFTVEPVPAYYLYPARILKNLDGTLAKYLGKAYSEVHGFREGGVALPTLDEELANVTELFYGLHLESCYNLGLKPATTPGEVKDPKAAVERARAFATGWKDDPAFAADIRRLLPLAPSKTVAGADGINCLAVLGVRAVEVVFEYGNPPAITGGEPTVGGTSYTVLLPVVTEVVIPGRKIMSREDFIALCDRYRTADELIAALEGRTLTPHKVKEEEEPGSVLNRLDAGTKVLIIILGAFVVVLIVVLIKKRAEV